MGTHIRIEHRSAVGIGTLVRAEAVVESFDGRFYGARGRPRRRKGNRPRDRGPSRGELGEVQAAVGEAGLSDLEIW